MTLSNPRIRALIGCLAVSAAALAAACDSGPTQPKPTLTVSATGRLERSSVLAVTVSNGATVLAPGQVALSFSPAGAAEVQADGSVRLLRAGQLTVTATSNGLVGSTQLDVAAPPVVVFDRLFGGNRDIWRVDLDGQNLTQLVSDLGDDQDPTAVKGNVVFVSYRTGNGNLFSIPLAGGTTTQLTTTPRDETTPALSLDGLKLAYSYSPIDVTKIYTSTAAGTGAARLVPSPADVIETSPTWSPSGVVAYVNTAAGSADVGQAIPGGATASLITNPAADVEPTWSVDGQMLAFVSNRNGGVDIFIRASSAVETQVTTGAGSKFNPAFTADGRLVYVEQVGGVTHLRWLDPADPAHASTLIETGAGTVAHPSVNIP